MQPSLAGRYCCSPPPTRDKVQAIDSLDKGTLAPSRTSRAFFLISQQRAAPVNLCGTLFHRFFLFPVSRFFFLSIPSPSSCFSVYLILALCFPSHLSLFRLHPRVTRFGFVSLLMESVKVHYFVSETHAWDDDTERSAGKMSSFLMGERELHLGMCCLTPVALVCRNLAFSGSLHFPDLASSSLPYFSHRFFSPLFFLKKKSYSLHGRIYNE